MNLLPSHPLYGCQLRVLRADGYIKEAVGIIRAFESECEDLVVRYHQSPDPLPAFPNVPDDLSLAVSDAIHNLRSALDYLVYELAILDSRATQDGTQFPIEHMKAGKSPSNNQIGFDAVAPRYLKGLNLKHIGMIENLQPYNGTKWTQDLKDISNPDKHRKLTSIHKGSQITVWVDGPNGRGKSLPNGDTVKVDANHTVLIELPNRNLLISSSLYSIEAGVADAINLFKGEF